jgi:4-hydroxyphenylpyruvate dioxygenase
MEERAMATAAPSALDNPLGTDGFEFVEFTSPEPAALADLFERLGFTAVGTHRRKDVIHYRQGDINFILNRERSGQPAEFANVHGASANAMAFRVADAAKAFEEALRRGAEPVSGAGRPDGTEHPRHRRESVASTFTWSTATAPTASTTSTSSLIAGASPCRQCCRPQLHRPPDPQRRPRPDGQVGPSSTSGSSTSARRAHFDIKGRKTGLFSRAMTSPCGKIRIPLNESQDEKSQIAEFLRRYNGEGIQHIALGCDDIYQTVPALRARGVPFQQTLDAYYELIDKRLPGHGEDVDALHREHILIDGGEAQGGGKLLQIFTEEVIGPVFFEIIQRKGNQGFGEGNFQALFESIELDQERRGVI